MPRYLAFLLLAASCRSGGVSVGKDTSDTNVWYPSDSADDTDVVETADTGETDISPGDPAWVLSSLVFEEFLESDGLNLTVNGWLAGTMPPESDVNIILWVPDIDFVGNPDFEAWFGVGQALGGGDYVFSDASNPISLDYVWEGEAIRSTESGRQMHLADVGGFGFEIILYEAGISGQFENDLVDMAGHVTGCISEADAKVTSVMDYGMLVGFMDARPLNCNTGQGAVEDDGWTMIMAFTAFDWSR